MKTTAYLVIIGALGRVKKGTEKFISKIPGNFRIPELQKIVLVGTAHILEDSTIKYSSRLTAAVSSWSEPST